MRFCRGQTGDTNCGSTAAVSRKMHQYFLVVLYISLEFAAFGSGSDAKHSRASALWFILSTTMVFVAVQSHFPRKNTRFHLDWAAIEVTMSHEKRSVLKLTCVLRLWLGVAQQTVIVDTCETGGPGSIVRGGNKIYLFLFLSRLDYIKNARNRCVGK